MRQKVGNGVSYTRFPMPTLLYARYNVKLIYLFYFKFNELECFLLEKIAVSLCNDYIVILILKPGQSWRGGTKCDCNRDWLWELNI